MRRRSPGRRALALLLASLLGTGCASSGSQLSVPVVGRTITVVTEAEKQEVKGELLAVQQDRLFVRSPVGVREIPIRTVREARVKRHDFGARKAISWAAMGGLLTGIPLMAACSSVEGNGGCGGVGLVAFGSWMVVGLLAAPSARSSSRIELSRPSPEELRAYARLPQGLPAGVSPAALAAAPPEPAGTRK